MSPSLHPFRIEHYPAARALWDATEGLGLSDADAPGPIARYLDRNPGLSLVALEGETLVGTILAGHDGRRGLVYHLAVAPAHRRRGLGSRLLHEAMAALRAEGIDKAHILVFAANAEGRAFWERAGAHYRDTLALYSMATAARGAGFG